MADYYGVNFTKTRAVPTEFVGGGQYGGRIRCYYDEIVTTTAMTTADLIYVGKLYPGETFLGGWLYNAAHGSSRTAKLGDAGDDDRYLAATSTATAAKTDLGKVDGLGYKNDTPNVIDLFLTLAGGTLAASDDGFKLFYMVARD